MEKWNATEVIGTPMVKSLLEPMVDSDSESEDEVINRTISVVYNTNSSSDSGTDSDDNESYTGSLRGQSSTLILVWALSPSNILAVLLMSSSTCSSSLSVLSQSGEESDSSK